MKTPASTPDVADAVGVVVTGGAERFALLGGVVVGHATDDAGATGLTVVRGARGALRGAAAVVGRATGTREMLPVTSNHLVDRVDALLLAGGSAYGLDAAAGVMRWMEERGRGFPVGPAAGQVVPIVPAAVVFDLAPLGRFDARPTAEMAYDACERASAVEIPEGSVGAGAGATVGKGGGVEAAMKGGFGCAVATSLARGGGEALHVGALAVVNAFGDVRDASGAIIAGARARGGGFADTARLVAAGPPPTTAGGFESAAARRGGDPAPLGDVAMRNTTLAAVIVGAPLTRAELAQVAAASTAAFHRRITPAGTSFDGDVVFALSAIDDAGGAPPQREVAKIPDRDRHPSPAPRIDLSPAALMRVEALAVAALEHAIERAVRLARGRDGIPGLADDVAAPPPPSSARQEPA